LLRTPDFLQALDRQAYHARWCQVVLLFAFSCLLPRAGTQEDDAYSARFSSGGLSREQARERRECLLRIKRTEFSVDNFKSGWMNQANLTAFAHCMYRLRTNLRSNEKVVHAGGVHYPTLLATNHLTPPVSTASAQWCWLDTRGVANNGLTPEECCNTANGPNGLDACWDAHFNYDLCCLGDVGNRELPHHFVSPAFDINVGSIVRQWGTFDLGQSYALQTLCRSGDIVLDIGANIGGFTVPLAERVGPSGEVHAFEAFRKVYQHLNANVALNGLSNVYAHNVALGSAEKNLELNTADLTTWNFPSAMRVEGQYDKGDAMKKANLHYEKKREKIAVRTLDSFTFDRRVAVIKIDVEFMELEVVLGGRETIMRDKPVMWVENEPYFDDPPDHTFVDTMSSDLGYYCRPVARLELLCTPKVAEGAQDNSIGLPAGFNRVFQHLSGEVSDIKLWKVLSEVGPGFSQQGASGLTPAEAGWAT